ncbi:MAG: hypothetical protein QMD85_00740 [Candidatus Aenigmarchaeota archaeon]|nr:hypothetical protein [Candidatus Aenigmarchaeota archaeon]MDI6722064.1 hypothetical protein [Candidatus Aenigmarchaeota archaeon]
MKKHKEIRMRRQDLIFGVIVIFMLGAIIGISLLPPQKTENRNGRTDNEIIAGDYSVEMGIPAVDAEGRGVVGMLYTMVRPGTGRILVNVDNVLSQIDTQFSSRIAVKAAADYMKVDPRTIDVIFTLKVNATLVEGPSAGSAMAASVVLALDNITRNKIMMTGTIDEEGDIGSVGAIIEKARAAKEKGAEIFIVPSGQATETTSRREKSCKSYGSVNVCTITYVNEKVNISSSLNMTVLEAKNLDDIIKIYKDMSKGG